MAFAEESNLGTGVVAYSENDLKVAINKIRAAGEAYRSEYNGLVSYFENELQNEVQGETLDAFKACFNERKGQLKAVNDFIDDILEKITAKTNQGSAMADDLNSSVRS